MVERLIREDGDHVAARNVDRVRILVAAGERLVDVGVRDHAEQTVVLVDDECELLAVVRHCARDLRDRHVARDGQE